MMWSILRRSRAQPLAPDRQNFADRHLPAKPRIYRPRLRSGIAAGAADQVDTPNIACDEGERDAALDGNEPIARLDGGERDAPGTAGCHPAACESSGPGNSGEPRNPGAALVSGGHDAAATSVVRLGGDLRSGTVVESIRRRCLADVTPGRRRLVIDLEHVQEVDTKLIACLICLRRAADAAGVRLEVRLSPRVRDWLDHCRAGHLFRPSV
jgi:ABC-type transporter Mla MlaB component